MALTIPQQIEHIRAMWVRGEQGRARQMLQRLAWSNGNDPSVIAAMRDLSLQEGDYQAAVTLARRVVELCPGSALDRAFLGAALLNAGQTDEAEQQLRAALEKDPGLLAARRQLLLLLHVTAQNLDLLRVATEGRQLFPYEADFNLMIADGWSRLGEAERAAAEIGGALLRFPSERHIAEVHCFTVNNAMNADRTRVFLAHKNFGRLIAQTGGLTPAACPPEGDAGKRLRVGILSGDFKRHSVWHFITPWLEHADRQGFEIVCIPTDKASDRYAEFQRSLGHRFEPLEPGSHEQCSAQLRGMKLDVLIELAGLTGGNMLPLVHLRVAPVQATYIGYPNTTGVGNVDWRIVDSVTDPAGPPFLADTFATERLCRLDPCFLCYRPPLEGDLPALARAPADPEAPIVFGSFNAAWKVTGDVLGVWAKLLQRVPGARLLIKSAQVVHEPERRHLQARCAKAGIDPARLLLPPPPPDPRDHLSQYNTIDIALDTFPYQGTTTTCEALLMGVPVVSLAGLSHASRVGASLLAAAGVPEFSTDSVEGYVEVAAGLAADAGRLAAYHRDLRGRVLGSTLCDGVGFSRRLEGALRAMWTQACAKPAG